MTPNPRMHPAFVNDDNNKTVSAYRRRFWTGSPDQRIDVPQIFLGAILVALIGGTLAFIISKPGDAKNQIFDAGHQTTLSPTSRIGIASHDNGDRSNRRQTAFAKTARLSIDRPAIFEGVPLVFSKETGTGQPGDQARSIIPSSTSMPPADTDVAEPASPDKEAGTDRSVNAETANLEASLPIPIARPKDLEMKGLLVIPAPRPVAYPPQSVKRDTKTIVPGVSEKRSETTTPIASDDDARRRKTSTLWQVLGFAKSDPDDELRSRGKAAIVKRNDVAIYDIAASTVYLPNGEKLEAHSGIGAMRDDPTYVSRSNKGPTPPNTYQLSLRESPYHGIEAIRLTPLNGEDNAFGRNGFLAHTYMLGKDGDSHGCVVFRDYQRFLGAFKSGMFKTMVVVARLQRPPQSPSSSVLASKD